MVDLSFMKGVGGVVVAAVVFGGGAFLFYKSVTRSTAPKDPMINTGEKWEPGVNKPPVDNRPKPKPPPKNEV